MFFPLDLSAELDLKVIHAVCRQRDPRGEEGLRPQDDGAPASVRLRHRVEQFPQDREGLLGRGRVPGAHRQPATGPQPDQRLPPSSSRWPGWAGCSGHAAPPDGGAGEPGPYRPGWHQGESPCQQTQGYAPRADASAQRASAKQWSERQLEGEMRSLLRKTEIIDAQEDGQHGKGKRGDELPPELRRRNRPSRRARGPHRRAEDAQRLAIETAQTRGLVSPILRSGGNRLAMPSRHSGSLTGEGSQHLNLHQPAGAWPAAQAIPGTSAQRS